MTWGSGGGLPGHSLGELAVECSGWGCLLPFCILNLQWSLETTCIQGEVSSVSRNVCELAGKGTDARRQRVKALVTTLARGPREVTLLPGLLVQQQVPPSAGSPLPWLLGWGVCRVTWAWRWPLQDSGDKLGRGWRGPSGRGTWGRQPAVRIWSCTVHWRARRRAGESCRVRKSGLRCDAEGCTGTCPGTEERKEPLPSGAVFSRSWRKFEIGEEAVQDSILQSLCSWGFPLGGCHTDGL